MVMDALGDGTEDLEGAHYIMFLALTAEFEKYYLSIQPLSGKRQSAPRGNLRRHIPAPCGKVQTVTQNLLAGRHCVPEYIMNYV